MIDTDHSDPDIVVLRPQGPLSEADFEQLAAGIDERINTTDKVPNLVVCLDKLPYWDSIGAMTRHFHLVKEHQKIIRKVAIVGDNPLLSVAPEIADKLVKAKVRHFPQSKLEEAKAWARSEQDDPGHFEILEDLPRDVIGLRAVGVITAKDYRDTLLPLVEAKSKEHDKLKCLLVIDDDYATFSADAAWSDMKFDLMHSWKFTRIAFVSDIGWMTKMAQLFGPLMPPEIVTFPVAKLEEARSWIKR